MKGNMQFIQNILLNLYSKLYPTEQSRFDAAKETIQEEFLVQKRRFNAEIKQVLGKSAACIGGRHTDAELISMIKETVAKLDEIEASREGAAKKANVSSDKVFDAIMDLPEIEDNISTLKQLLERGNERKRQLVNAQKEGCKNNIEDYQKRIEQEKQKLDQLNQEITEVAKEEAEVKQIILNQEEK